MNPFQFDAVRAETCDYYKHAKRGACVGCPLQKLACGFPKTQEDLHRVEKILDFNNKLFRSQARRPYSERQARP